jgi:tetratricopeptide (TPR) repeat protein
VAAALLRAGVASVVAMSHSVLVETARRFVEAFYGGLVAGERIGTAMATAQRALQRNRVRGELDPQAPWKQRGGDARGEGGDLERQDGGDALEAGGAGPRGGLDAGMRGGGDAGLRGERDAASGRLELDDWLVPVLFQEGDGDPPLVPGGADTSPLARHARQLRAEQVRGKLPPPPPHTFVGRGRELLAIDRALVGAPEGGRLLALVGPGGLGKTALAAETARFLLAIRRVQRVAFASVEQLSDARGVVAAIGEQLVPGYVIATAERTGRDEEKLHNAMLPIEKALWGMRALIVIDNLESILPAPGAEPSDEVKAVLGVLWRLAKAGETRVGLTSRESVPAVLGAAGGGTGVGSVAARAAGTAGEGLGAASAAVEAHAQGGATLELRLGRLGRREAMELLRAVLRRHDLSPAGEAGQEQVEALVETVGGHARSLVLLAREVASRGLGAVADDVREAMRALERRHPGATDEQKRELSVIASVNLSLRRLPEAVRRQIRPLAVFHGPAHVAAIAHVLEMKPDGALRLCGLLMAVGLADAEGPYLLPDPALGAALAEDFTVEERAAAEARWLEAVEAFVAFLYEQQFKDARVATQGARTTLADVLAALHQIVAQVDGGVRDAAKAIHFVTSVEALVRLLGLPRVLRRISAARQGIAARLSAWSHARFAAESQEFERKLEAGDLPGALRAARAIHAEMEAVGDAYPEAAYDRAMSWFRLGRVLRSGGAAEQALDVLRQAEKRFEALAASHGEAAARMASTAITDQGDALLDLGRLDEAAAAYERATRQAESLGDLRSVAVSQGQLGTVRMLQGRHDDAIAAHAEARETFEKLGEPGSVATAWHQIGRVHQEAQRFDAAEAAYRRSLALQVARGNKAGEAAALLQLGSLYDDQGQLDEAAKYYRQVVELRRALGDKQGEGRAQTNLGVTLHRLRRFGEARAALKGALALKMDMGHASEPWNTWAVLARVERDAGCPGAAGEAHDQAMASYRAYRTDGGEPMRADTRLIAAFGQVLRTQGADAVLAVLAKIDDTPAWLHPVLESLRSLAAGDRDPGLAADPRLEPEAAVELALVLEALTAPS